MTKCHTRLNTKDNILYGSLYMKFWKRQKCKDRRQMRGWLGLRVGGGVTVESGGNFPRVMETVRVTMVVGVHRLFTFVRIHSSTLEIAEFYSMKAIPQ